MAHRPRPGHHHPCGQQHPAGERSTVRAGLCLQDEIGRHPLGLGQRGRGILALHRGEQIFLFRLCQKGQLRPRGEGDPALVHHLQKLSESIKEFGMAAPILTRLAENGDGYEVIAGQRQHMDMIRAHLRLYYLNLFPLTQRSQYFSYFSPLFPIEHLPSIFWRKYDMIFAIPFRM